MRMRIGRFSGSGRRFGAQLVELRSSVQIVEHARIVERQIENRERREHVPSRRVDRRMDERFRHSAGNEHWMPRLRIEAGSDCGTLIRFESLDQTPDRARANARVIDQAEHDGIRLAPQRRRHSKPERAHHALLGVGISHDEHGSGNLLEDRLVVRGRDHHVERPEP